MLGWPYRGDIRLMSREDTRTATVMTPVYQGRAVPLGKYNDDVTNEQVRDARMVLYYRDDIRRLEKTPGRQQS